MYYKYGIYNHIYMESSQKQVKTTVVFPKTLWVQFQHITGPKKSSAVLSRLVHKLVQHYHSQKLLSRNGDESWDDSYLDDAFRKEVQVLHQSL
jgi:hypothetical protein